jgi:hypothetical protein
MQNLGTCLCIAGSLGCHKPGSTPMLRPSTARKVNSGNTWQDVWKSDFIKYLLSGKIGHACCTSTNFYGLYLVLLLLFAVFYKWRDQTIKCAEHLVGCDWNANVSCMPVGYQVHMKMLPELISVTLAGFNFR